MLRVIKCQLKGKGNRKESSCPNHGELSEIQKEEIRGWDRIVSKLLPPSIQKNVPMYIKKETPTIQEGRWHYMGKKE